MKSPETLFTESTLDITIPNGILHCNETDAERIFTGKPRAQAFYDENLHFYLIFRLPADSDITDKAAATQFFSQLEIVAEACLIDASALSTPQPNPPAVYRLPPNSGSRPTSPLPGSMDKKVPKIDGTVIYSYMYNPKQKDREMLVLQRNNCWCCVAPLAVPVAYVKTRIHAPALALTALVSLRQQVDDPIEIDEYNEDNFSTINLFEGFADDPLFDKASKNLVIPMSRIYAAENRQQNMYPTTPGVAQRRSFRKILPVKSALNVRMRTTSVSPLDNVLMMSVELENNTEASSAFSVETVQVDVISGLVTKYDWGPSDDIKLGKFPLTLHPVDQVTFLYSITILEENTAPKSSSQYCPPPNPLSRPQSRRSSAASIYSVSSNTVPSEDRQRHVSIVVRGSPVLDGVKSRTIESRWNCMLDLSNLRKRDDMMSPNVSGMSGFNPRLSMSSFAGGPKVPPTPGTPRPTMMFSPTGMQTPKSRRNASALPTIPDYEGSNGFLEGGRTPRRQPEIEVGDGVVVSFSVNSKVSVGKLFTIQVFIVNRSKHVRRFTIVTPNKRRPGESALKNLPPLPAGSRHPVEFSVLGHQYNPVEPFLDEGDFLKRYLEFETNEAGIICLENNVRLGPLNPLTCETTELHFIAVRESLHIIELVQLVDNDTGFTTNLRNVLEIFIGKD